jgi:hypothetical protein
MRLADGCPASAALHVADEVMQLGSASANMAATARPPRGLRAFPAFLLNRQSLRLTWPAPDRPDEASATVFLFV